MGEGGRNDGSKPAGVGVNSSNRAGVASTDAFTVQIDHLPEEPIQADGPNDAASIVAGIIKGRDSLQRLDDTEPVQIKRPNRVPWGRNLTIADFRAATPPTADDEGPEGEGPVQPPSI